MNEFLEKAHKQIIDSMPQLAPDTGLFTVDIIVNNVIDGMLYRFKPNHEIRMSHIVILTISSDVGIGEAMENIIYSLIDKIGINKDKLIIIHSDGNSKQENDIQAFFSDNADIFHPDYIRFSCSKETMKTSIDGEKYLRLDNMLKRFYSETISFVGPIAGKQSVNIEVYRDTCPRCGKEINIVSGFVFPRIQLPSWDNPFWQYYNTLIPIYQLSAEYVRQVKQEVIKLRKSNIKITPLIFYQDVEQEESGWTVMCPCCNSVIDQYSPEDNRMQYLFDKINRENGNLEYHSILINADQDLINLLNESYESNSPHVCYAGWVELKTTQS
jgi:hypothetical protein